MFKSAYSDRERVRFETTGKSRVQQHFKRECDVNHILARYKNAMRREYLADYKGYVQGQFGDASIACDYREACERVQQAEDAFASLPAAVRSRFNNDPAGLLDFIGNEANKEEAIKLGLIDAPNKPMELVVDAPK